MNASRRGILGMFAAAPVAARAVSETIGSAATAPYPPTGAAGFSAQNSILGLPQPVMDRGKALRMIWADKDAIDAIKAELWDEQRHVTSVDPDLMVLKSFSPMAKITFQRQRNVERALAEAMAEGYWNRPSRYIHALSERLDALMFGKSRA